MEHLFKDGTEHYTDRAHQISSKLRKFLCEVADHAKEENISLRDLEALMIGEVTLACTGAILTRNYEAHKAKNQ